MFAINVRSLAVSVMILFGVLLVPVGSHSFRLTEPTTTMYMYILVHVTRSHRPNYVGVVSAAACCADTFVIDTHSQHSEFIRIFVFRSRSQTGKPVPTKKKTNRNRTASETSMHTIRHRIDNTVARTEANDSSHVAADAINAIPLRTAARHTDPALGIARTCVTTTDHRRPTIAAATRCGPPPSDTSSV